MSKKENKSMSEELHCDVLILGGGPGGYSAAFRAADMGLNVVIVEERPGLGGVCLNVGCIPSKTYLHHAALIGEVTHASKAGIVYGKPTIDTKVLLNHKNEVVQKLVSGLSGLAKARNVRIVHGHGHFLSKNTLAVGKNTPGKQDTIHFKYCVIAAGSAPSRLPFLPTDPKIMDSTAALELPNIPEKMLVIGGGIIGLEMATVYSALGTTVDVVELSDGLMPGTDRDAVSVWEKINTSWLGHVFLETKVAAVEIKSDGVWVSFEGKAAPKAPQCYGLVLESVGRSPNGGKLMAEQAGVNVDRQGFITVDVQMRTNIPHIFAIGDISSPPMLAHKAVHEGHVAAEVIAGELLGHIEDARAVFDARVIPSVAYTHPEIAWVGVTETQANNLGKSIEVSKFPWAASGRALANRCEYGFTKLILDAENKSVIGGVIVGPSAGDMIGEIALAIEMGADVADLALTIHPHPTLGESIGLAAELALGWCTDLPPKRKK